MNWLKMGPNFRNIKIHHNEAILKYGPGLDIFGELNLHKNNMEYHITGEQEYLQNYQKPIGTKTQGLYEKKWN